MTQNSKSYLLKCLNCGANLEIPTSVSLLVCSYCNCTQNVIKEGGIVSLRILNEKVEKIENKVNLYEKQIKLLDLKQKLHQLQNEQEDFFVKMEKDSAEHLKNLSFMILPVILIFLAFLSYTIAPSILLLLVLFAVISGLIGAFKIYDSHLTVQKNIKQEKHYIDEIAKVKSEIKT